MRSDLHITPALITRRYDQGLDSIIRLVTDLTDRIEDLSALHVGKPQRTIRAQQAENRTVIYQADECRHCGAALVAASANNFHKRQVFEIENGTLTVVEHRASLKSCPACGNVSKGQFPAAVKAPVQYGASVLSRALYLHLYQLLPVTRTQEAMRDLFGCDISQASIQRAARLCSDKLIRCEQRRVLPEPIGFSRNFRQNTVSQSQRQ